MFQIEPVTRLTRLSDICQMLLPMADREIPARAAPLIFALLGMAACGIAIAYPARLHRPIQGRLQSEGRKVTTLGHGWS